MTSVPNVEQPFVSTDPASVGRQLLEPEKGDRSNLPERPGGCFAQIGPVPFFRPDPLLRDLADHPLSLELVGPHLRSLTPEEIPADFGKLLDRFQQTADEGRNRSLLASLEFSRRHLSPAARAVLPWLGLFSGGVFEINLLRMSQMEPAAWELIRAELQGIALLRTEDDIQIAGRPFLRFHPTRAIASADSRLAEQPETRERFLHVYLALKQALHKGLKGTQPRTALEILDREEANYRTAVRWAVADNQRNAAAVLGETLATFLNRSAFDRFYDFFSRSAWIVHDLAHQVAVAIVVALNPRGVLYLVVDDTLLHKRGKRVSCLPIQAPHHGCRESIQKLSPWVWLMQSVISLWYFTEGHKLPQARTARRRFGDWDTEWSLAHMLRMLRAEILANTIKPKSATKADPYQLLGALENYLSLAT